MVTLTLALRPGEVSGLCWDAVDLDAGTVTVRRTMLRDGTLKEFKRGGTAMMLKAADGLPVIPTTVVGSWRLAQDNMLPVPFGTHVHIRFGDPIPRSEGDVDDLLDRVETTIRQTAEELGRQD